MSASKSLLDNLDKLVVLSDEPCSEEFDCKHCFANQCLDDLRRLIDDWLDIIKTDYK